MTPDRNALAFKLRGYQEHTVGMNFAAHNGDRRPTGEGVQLRTGNILATGLGKTVIFSEMIRRAHLARKRSLVLVHREELAIQAQHKIHSMTPGASIGIVKAESNDWQADVVIASVPTLGQVSDKRRRQIPAGRFGLGIADECHHAAADSWQRVMNYFGAMPWAGFTATMGRGDKRALGETWAEIVAEYDIGYGIREHYLVPPKGKRIRVKNLLLDEVKRSRGDLQDDDLGAAMEDADAGNTIAKAYLEHYSGKRAVMFCPTVSSAIKWAADLNEAGIVTEVVTGETTSAERAGIYERFRIGTTLVVSSCMVLTEGWDAAWAEVAIMARPTTSANLYIQCVGRVLRPWIGKTEAAVMDVVGVSERLSLASLKDLFPELRGDASPYGDDEDQPDDAPEPKEASAPEDLTKDFIDGEIVAFETDLFSDSDSAWLLTEPATTYGPVGERIWFIPTRYSYFYLWPKGDGTFGLGQKSISERRGHGKVLEKSLTLEGGMAWAERYAAEEDPSISSRKSAWRKSKPSEAMLKLAAGLHIEVFPHTRQGELSDKITARKASQSLPTPK